MWEAFYVALTVLAILILYGVVRALVQRRRGPVSVHPLDAEGVDKIDQLNRQGRYIEAIKALREHTGLPLTEAKERIDTWDVTQERERLAAGGEVPPAN